MKKLFLALAGLVALTQVSCVKDESTYVHITNVKGVVINEVYTFSNQSEADDLDWIELYNTTAADIDLTDVLMWEGGGAEEAWAFPKGSIIPANGYFVVECDKYGLLNNPKKHPAWGLSKGPDEVIVLANSDQKVIDEIALPSLLENETYGRTSDGDKEWKIFKNGTKGAKNEGPGRDEFENTTGLFVNEVYHDNSDEYVADGWDASVDFVEFYNANDTDYDISGYSLYDEKHEEEDKYIFPEGTIVPAKGFLTFDIDKDDPTNPSLSLGAGGDWLFLYDENGVKVEEIEIPAFSKESGLRDQGYTFGRQPDGSTTLVIFTEATKNASNNDAAVLEGGNTEPEPEPEPEPGQPSTGEAKVVFNELCGNKVEYGDFPEAKFIELYNAGEGDAALAGWTIRKYVSDEDNVDGYEVPWTAPEGMTIAAGAYLVLVADQTDPTLGFDAGLSAKKGVKFELLDADGNVVDKFVRGADTDPFGEEPLTENKTASFSRVPNGTGSFAYAVPTPGAANGESTGEIEGYTAPEEEPTPEPAKEAKVVFNELCGNKVEYGDFPEAKFIELYNAGEGDAALAGWTIRKYVSDEDNVDGYEVPWTAPEGMTIAAGAYLVLVADQTDPTLGFDAGLSAKKGVKFELLDADGNVVDKFVRGADTDPFGEEPLTENKTASFSRVPNGTGSFAYAVPTPGAANGESTGEIEGYTAPEA